MTWRWWRKACPVCGERPRHMAAHRWLDHGDLESEVRYDNRERAHMQSGCWCGSPNEAGRKP